MRRGANYGWPDSEGACSAPCTSPLFCYPHNGRDAAVTGGFVYHGTASSQRRTAVPTSTPTTPRTGSAGSPLTPAER